MLKLKIILITLILLLFPTSSLISNIFSTTFRVIVVPDEEPSIGKAVSKAKPYSTIIVKSGLYDEMVHVNKPLTIKGEGNVLITQMVKVESSEVTLESMSIEIIPKGTLFGVEVKYSSGVKLRNLTLIGCGILIAHSEKVLIEGSSFFNNPGWGIDVYNSSEVLVKGCTFNQTWGGLAVHSGSKVKFIGNTIMNPISRWVYLFRDSSECEIYLNNFLGDPLKIASIDEGRGNKWFNEEVKRGNYWQHWAEVNVDGDGDGVIDSPRAIDGSAKNFDKYPLASLYEEHVESTEQRFEEQSLTLLTLATVLVIIFIVLIVSKLMKNEVDKSSSHPPHT